jgi:serine/threonine protein kinase
VFRGEHRVVRLLGKGSMGVVYLVEGARGEHRALKLLLPEALRDERALERFHREATASQQIASEHVVKTLEAGIDEDTGQPWLLMEYVEGDPLDDALERGILSRAQREELLGQLFRAATAIHKAGFVHRDLKPDNILLCPEGGSFRLKILDLGVAKRLGISPNNSTAQGLGTPLWTAPEQSTERRGIGPSADVWALGLLAFRFLTGQFYWKEASQPKIGILNLILEINKGAITPPSERLRELGVEAVLPPGFDAWFQRCVNRDPRARFQEAGEAHRLLEIILAPPSLSAPQRAPFPPSEAPSRPSGDLARSSGDLPAPRSSAVWVIVAALAALLVVVAVAARLR